jgi:uncharacterized protein (DUF1330 family)
MEPATACLPPEQWLLNMTAYMVLTHTVHDAAAFARDYVPAIRPVLRKHDIEVIAISLDTTPLEGQANSAVVFRAASEEVFREFYDDPDFEGPKQLRHSMTSDRTMVVVPALG